MAVQGMVSDARSPATLHTASGERGPASSGAQRWKLRIVALNEGPQESKDWWRAEQDWTTSFGVCGSFEHSSGGRRSRPKVLYYHLGAFARSVVCPLPVRMEPSASPFFRRVDGSLDDVVARRAEEIKGDP